MGSEKHCVVYPDLDSFNKLSGVILYNNLIISTAASLAGPLQDNKFKGIIKSLENYEIVDARKPDISNLFKSVSYSIICDDNKNTSADTKSLNTITVQKTNSVKEKEHAHNEVLYSSKARVLYIFNSKNIAIVFENILKDLSGIKQTYEDKIKQILLSSFVILEFDNDTKVNSDINSLSHYKNNDFSRKSNHVFTVTTPFGNNSFFATKNYGIVSNILGVNNCLAIISNTLVQGCQGAGVFDDNENLLGLIVVTNFIYNEAEVILTLAASMREIIHSFFMLNDTMNLNIKDNDCDRLKKHVVLIDSGAYWGTGCLVKINSLKLILTCSHVISGDNSITCFWKYGKTKNVKILYKSKNFTIPYDIAVLEILSDEIPDDFFASMCNTKPIVGDTIYSVGFPFFKFLGTQNFKPSIFKGRITKHSKGILYTDSLVQTGQSGGPLFNNQSQIVGITVSNSINVKSKTVYPNINMAVPIFDIKDVLDSGEFNKLLADKEIVKKWNLESPLIVTKI